MSDHAAASIPNVDAERFFQIAPDPFCCLDHDGSLSRVNVAFARLVGLPEHELVGRSFLEFVHPNDLEPTRGSIEASWAREPGRLIVNRFGASPGTHRTVSWTASPDRDASLLYLAGRDVTEPRAAAGERERLLQEMNAQRAHLAEIVNQSPSLMAVMRGPDLVIEEANELCAAYFRNRELVGLPLRDVLRDVGGLEYYGSIERVYRTAEPFTDRGVRIVRHAGPGEPLDVRFLDIVFHAMRDGYGRVTGVIGQGVDQTEQARALDALRASEAKYHSLFESIDQGFALCEAVRDASGQIVDYRFLEVNPAFTAITGFRPETAVGRTIQHLTPTVDPASVERCASVVETGEPVTFEDVVPEMGQWFEVSAYPRGGDRFAVMFRDTTARKHAEQERERLLQDVETERARLAAVVQQAPSMLAVTTGPDHVIEHANDLYLRFIGREDVVGRPVREVLPELERQGILDIMDEVYRTGAPFIGSGVPIAVRMRPGEPLVERLIDANWQPLRDAAGTITGIVKHGLDQTERIQAEEELRASEARYRTLFDTMEEGFCTFDILFDAAGRPCDLRFIEVNPAFARQTGLEDAAGRTIRELAPNVENFWFDTYAQVARTGEPARFVGQSPALGNRWFEIHAFRLGNTGSARIGTTFQNITERKRAEQERERLLREAQEAVRARDVFLSIASHELRNPVTSIKAAAQLLQRSYRKGTLDERRATRYIDTLVTSSDRLAVLLEDLLDVSRLQSGQLNLRREPTNLATLVRETIDLHPVLTRRHHIGVEIQADRALPVDAERIRQILVNLLDNAVKYSPHGGDVSVVVADNERGVTIRVRDQGIGLSPDFLESVFQPFGRATNANARNIPGMGLGLFICRSIAEAHGGRLWAESEGDGKGTTMTLWLPDHPEPRTAATQRSTL